jgi:hypothetical protein
MCMFVMHACLVCMFVCMFGLAAILCTRTQVIVTRGNAEGFHIMTHARTYLTQADPLTNHIEAIALQESNAFRDTPLPRMCPYLLTHLFAISECIIICLFVQRSRNPPSSQHMSLRQYVPLLCSVMHNWLHVVSHAQC